ncbi:MAG TPA: formylglycine-generating enzyme family protein [Anaerolineales bacterium]|nr:formylglycine-generating enzyme family protein [Anaerolineales bacterium]
MKRLIGILLAVVWLAGCAPASTPTPTALPPTSEPTATPVPPTSAPTLPPVALGGPSSGTTMTWLDGSVLVYIPAGEFIMGLGSGDAPTKTVTLDPYWIQQTEVTNQMYAQCLAGGNCSAPVQEVGTPPLNSSQYGNYPVVGVTWNAANTYCQWIGGQLPSEAEWEKAARGQDGNKYPWGNGGPSCSLANYATCEGHTTSVNDQADGKSPYGLLDMAGNVFEWVNDYYDPNYYASAPSSDPTGPATGTQRVSRGSSFETDAAQLFSAIRRPAAPDYHSRDLGFRCVVLQPKAFAPYCQSASYLPTGGGQGQNGSCPAPQAQVRGNYCQGPNSFVTVDLSQGATYQVASKDFSCDDAVISGQRRLTCSGPDNSSTDLTICNAACNGSPNAAGPAAVCDPGYKLDAASNACLYAPVSAQPGVGGCGQGYNLIERGGQQVCAIGQNQNGQCPMGLYFDSQYGACVSASGQAYAPYGIDDGDLASKNYQGCAAGYTYSAAYQCCQAATGGAYPGCPQGFMANATQKTCVPAQVRAGGPGCVTVQLNTLQCGPVVDVCNQYKTDVICIRSGCHWNLKKNVCQTAAP